jgi:hypothetical protein
MPVATSSLTVVAVLLGMLSLWAAVFVVRRKSWISDIPGPPSPSWLYGRPLSLRSLRLTKEISGNLVQLLIPESHGDYEFGWQRQYGPVYRVRGCFGVRSSQIHWCRGLNRFVVGRSPSGLRPCVSSIHFERLILQAEPGSDKIAGYHMRHAYCRKSGRHAKYWTALSPLNTVSDDSHRRVRAGLNPAFTSGAVRKFTPIFQRAAEMVRSMSYSTRQPQRSGI